MTTYLRFLVVAVGFSAAAAVPAIAMAMSNDDETAESRESVDPEYAKAVQAIKTKDWNRAVELLTQAAARDEKNPDIYNYLGYAERHRGNLGAAFKHYDRALALDPKHRGAHEYLGEAYLMSGNLAKAEEHLATLDKLCFLPCSEYRELKEKIAEYKQKHR